MKKTRIQVFQKEVVISGSLLRTARLDAEQFQWFDDPEGAIRELRRAKERVDVFSFVEPLSHTSPRFPYAMEWDNLATLPLSTYDHWWTTQINGKTRNMVRRAEKSGVITREMPYDDACVRGISGVYNESAMRQGKRFRHYQKDLETVRRENGTFPDRTVFVGAFFEEQLIGFAKIVRDERGHQAGLMQIVAMIGHRDKAPTNALIAQAVRSCVDRGIPYLFYSHFAYGKKQRDSLSDFKEHNGFMRVDLPRYFAPLTSLGELAIRFGFHRMSLIDRVPESVQSKLRAIRNLRSELSVEATRKSS